MRTGLMITAMLMQLSSKLVGGYSMKYLDGDRTDRAKNRLLTLHALLSFVLAFGITNTFW